MSGLFDYLDVAGPEYAWLGHFRCREYLEAGHNTDRDYLGPMDQPAGGPMFQRPERLQDQAPSQDLFPGGSFDSRAPIGPFGGRDAP